MPPAYLYLLILPVNKVIKCYVCNIFINYLMYFMIIWDIILCFVFMSRFIKRPLFSRSKFMEKNEARLWQRRAIMEDGYCMR